MAKKTVRDITIALKTYLEDVQNGDICDNADVQRLAGSFDTREVNELVYTTLTGDHIPELILAECIEDGLTYIVDGLQRTSMLKLFKYGNHKITSAIDESIIEYSKKKRDKDGAIIKNERGQVEWENATLNLKNKTYELLPDELKKEFNDFQIHIVVHENCTMKRISTLIKRYNYQRPMTIPQKAFTYIDNFAVKARAISNKRLFVECKGYKDSEKINGTIERVVTESVMCMFHLDDWKRASKDLCVYLNNNSDLEEFEKFEEVVERLGNIFTPDFNSIFTSKNSFVWFNLFYKFSKLGLNDEKFVDFIQEFNDSLKSKIVKDVTYKEMKDITYEKLDKEAGTKDKVLILAKLELLETLMHEFLLINKEDLEEVDTLEFVKEYVKSDATEEDVEFYSAVLDDLTLDVDNNTKLLDKHNRPSLVALVGYACENDIDLDEWIKQWFIVNSNYILNQKQNYLQMVASLQKGAIR